MVKKIVMLGILVIFLTNIASADIVGLDVTPVGPDVVVPGGSIDYRVSVVINEPATDSSTWVREVFSILDERYGWAYSFSPATVTLDNTQGDSRGSILTITVPESAKVGTTYVHTVGATGTTEWDASLGMEGQMLTMTVVDTPIAPVSEFNTGILTSIGIFGLFIVSRRYKYK